VSETKTRKQSEGGLAARTRLSIPQQFSPKWQQTKQLKIPSPPTTRAPARNCLVFQNVCFFLRLRLCILKKLLTFKPDATIAKRSLLHPAIPSPYAGASAPKVVYVGTRTPFISALKRVRALLGHVDKRGVQAALAASGRGRGRGRGRGGIGAGSNGRGRGQANGSGGAQNEAEKEAVVVKATGKAVEKAMGLAVAMMAEKGWRVKVRTGSVAAIDDVVVGEVEEEEAEVKEAEVKETEKKQGGGGNVGMSETSTEAVGDEMGIDAKTDKMDVDVEASRGAESKGPAQHQEELEAESEAELPETRIRYTGMLEIEVTLRNDD